MRSILPYILCTIFSILYSHIKAQSIFLTGKISEIKENGELAPLPYANVYWLGTQQGTSTNENGEFTLNKTGINNNLVVSYVGYKNDTILIKPDEKTIDIILTTNISLDEVVVNANLEGAYISRLKPIKTEIITEHGLQQLACCNLSESFQNNATVDVGFTDAVSGAKQIQLLGLSGIYGQIMTENIPSVRGLSSTYGLDYIPGAWMESIQISKGAASVINGYESTTGQINVEYKKPENTDKLSLNIYGNSDRKIESNFTVASKIGNKFNTALFGHTSMLNYKSDMNNDGFIDIPVGTRINIINRWIYKGNHDESIRFLINGLSENREGGQIQFNNKENIQNQDYYGIGINTKRLQAFLKAGVPLKSRAQTSIGLQLSGTYHKQESYFGNNVYNGTEKSLYSNIIYQSYILNTNHLISAGGSFMQNNYSETLNDSAFNKTEYIPGAFAQYNYKYLEKLDFILGVRADNNSKYGLFITPRVHLRYALNDMTTFRASAGKGYRSPLLISENLNLLATSRSIIIHKGIKAEEAWNYGASITRDFHWSLQKEASISIDYFRTVFINQVILDLDKNVHQVHFYNLNGISRSNSYQINVNVTPAKGASITAAFRYNDVKAEINTVFTEKPFVNKYKGLLALSYLTKFDKWQFDFTAQYNGNCRLPSTSSNPEEYRRNNHSKEYLMLYAQITKRFKHLDIYAGSENLTDYKQPDPVIAADNPFGQYFDASMIWGPVTGRMFYAGLRYTIK